MRDRALKVLPGSRPDLVIRELGHTGWHVEIHARIGVLGELLVFLGVQVSYGVEQVHLVSEHPMVVLVKRTTPSAVGHLYTKLICKTKRSVEVVGEDAKRQTN